MPPGNATPAQRSSRPLPRLLLLVAAALLVARVATGVWEHPGRPTTTDRVAWVAIDRAVQESRRTRKPILYEFGADWCGPCQMMAHEVFDDPDLARRISGQFVPVRVLDRQREEGHNPPEVARLQDAYHVYAFPTLVVARPDQSDYRTISGYRGREGTMAWLTQASGAIPPRSAAPTDSPAGSH